MDFDASISDQSEIWGLQSDDFDLQEDLLADPSSSLWAETNHCVDDAWSMFEEQTPIKHCADIDFQFSDVGEIAVKDFDEGKETIQAKRRRTLQFCSENVEIECPTTDVLSESLQLNFDFSSDECLLNIDETEDLTEQWLVTCSQDSGHCCPPEEINSPSAVVEEANISACRKSLPQKNSDMIEKKALQARPTPLKAGRNVIRARKLASLAYPFELIKPSGFNGVVTLNDINKKLHAPPPYKITHKKDNEPASLQAPAISGKQVVHQTKIHTEGGKGTITITRTKG